MAEVSLETLASAVLDNILPVEQYYAAHNVPASALDPGRLARTQTLPADIETSRQNALGALEDLRARLQEPHEHINSMLFGHNSLASLRTLSTCNLFASSALPNLSDPSSSVSFEDLAKAIDLPLDNCKRMIRHAMSHYIFRESSDGRVQHTAASALLASSQDWQDWAATVAIDFWPVAVKLEEALRRWPKAQELDQTAMNLAYQTSKPFWGFLKDDPVREARFASSMRILSLSSIADAKCLAEDHLWETIGSGLVIDIGGSAGQMARTIAESYPALRFIVQDLPSVVETASTQNLPAVLQDRVAFRAHDFFTPQPPECEGASVYLLRQILHDWPDTHCLRILRALVPALRKNPGKSRVLIMDTVVPPVGALPVLQERVIRTFDLTMWALFNAKERDKEAWMELITGADPGLKVVDMRMPEGSRMGLIEVVWDGSD